MRLAKPSHEILTDIVPMAVLRRIEASGRTCYKSEERITSESAPKFVKMILDRGHESVIEHETISVRFICDRGVSHELVRHRLAAFSQESTRYCNYKGGVTFIIPPWVNMKPGHYDEDDIQAAGFSSSRTALQWAYLMLRCEEEYQDLLCLGWSPQQARSVLPNSLKTEIVMTANLREWRHVLRLRTSKAAHPQMRELMIPLLNELKAVLPVIFDDISSEE